MENVLVTWFSASGHTAAVAGRLASITDADFFQISPTVPYTAEDLDWTNNENRSSVEMRDRSCRPAIADVCPDMADYDTVFLGFPIWWYREPSIIDTFMESYDFTGKTIIPFCTSGGSGIEEASANLQKLAPGAQVETGIRVDTDVSAAELEELISQWI